jgi:hypothetical protein
MCSLLVSFKGRILLANPNQWYFNSLVKKPCHKTHCRCPYRLNLSLQSSRSCTLPNIKVLKDKDLEFANSIGSLNETSVYKPSGRRRSVRFFPCGSRRIPVEKTGEGNRNASKHWMWRPLRGVSQKPAGAVLDAVWQTARHDTWRPLVETRGPSKHRARGRVVGRGGGRRERRTGYGSPHTTSIRPAA